MITRLRCFSSPWLRLCSWKEKPSGTQGRRFNWLSTGKKMEKLKFQSSCSNNVLKTCFCDDTIEYIKFTSINKSNTSTYCTSTKTNTNTYSKVNVNTDGNDSTVIMPVVSCKFIFSHRVHHLLKVIWKVLPVCWKLTCPITKNGSSRLFAHGKEIVAMNHFKVGLNWNNSLLLDSFFFASARYMYDVYTVCLCVHADFICPNVMWQKLFLIITLPGRSPVAAIYWQKLWNFVCSILNQLFNACFKITFKKLSLNFLFMKLLNITIILWIMFCIFFQCCKSTRENNCIWHTSRTFECKELWMWRGGKFPLLLVQSVLLWWFRRLAFVMSPAL